MKQSIPFHNLKSKHDLHRFIKDNKDTLIAEKMMQTKFADPFSYITPPQFMVEAGDTFEVSKALSEGTPVSTKGILKTSVVINSTNIIDSYLDMHVPSLWKKSLLENRNIKFLQEHEMKFDKIISDKKDLKAYAKTMRWSDLGLPYKGVTEALVFDAVVKASRNLYMFEQYSEGHVDQHSVGMRYVSLVQCIDSDDPYFKDEKENWDAYYPLAVNPDVADEYGFFYAVTQAKVIEGSAVVLGANSATPTLYTQEMEPAKSIPVEVDEVPLKRTPINYEYLSDKLNLFN